MISILMPAFNAETFIRCAIQSILDQAVEMPMELIVVDDGSTDATPDIVREMSQDRQFIRLIQTENQGVSAARNRLLQEFSTASKFVAFLDSDDAMPPNRLSRDLALLQADPGLEFIYGKQALLTSEAADMMPEFTPRTPTIRGVSVNVATFRAQTIRDHVPFNTTFTHGEDADYLMKLFERKPKVHFLDDASLIYRQRAGSLCRDTAALNRGVMRAALESSRRRRKDPTLHSIEGIFENENIGELLYQSRAQAQMRKGLPDYSVIIPSHNAAEFLPEAIASIKDQTHPSSQIIVVDDGSTDNTQDVLSKLFPDVELIAQPQSGPGVATNTGIAAARHDILAFLDADDLWQPDKMERQICLLCLEPSIDLVFSTVESFQHGDCQLAVDDEVSGFCRTSLCARKSAFDKVGKVTDYGTRAGEMIDWFTRAAEQGLVTKLIELPLARRRLHNNSMTAKKKDHIAEDYLDVVKDAIRRKRALRKAQK
ncbi:glycosyltransferase family 2 protein [Roseobacter sp. CCS2]|uniref:glycosyltransferase family 2 protein n=1 Tax=Roseobacter sp. CCS2 TaxID=391593 RepID=UPI0000F3E241|nr:glycosyltransferase family A protein [Roseobacter sp. CCS2]EBA12644.1 sugar transferase-putative a glycosyl transferase [Roseobacter sp. CCS2]